MDSTEVSQCVIAHWAVFVTYILRHKGEEQDIVQLEIIWGDYFFGRSPPDLSETLFDVIRVAFPLARIWTRGEGNIGMDEEFLQFSVQRNLCSCRFYELAAMRIVNGTELSHL